MVTWLAALLAALLAAVTIVVAVRLTRTLRNAEDLAAALERQLAAADRAASRAHAEKREAQRILAILSEPLKDWDLADFPGIARSVAERHLTAIRDAYRVVAVDAAHARMTIKVGDRARRRGWADQPVDLTRAPVTRRNLP